MSKQDDRAVYSLLELTQIDAEAGGVSEERFAKLCLGYAAEMIERQFGSRGAIAAARGVIDAMEDKADG